MTPQLHIVITWYTFYHHTKFGNARIDKSYSLNKNMISWPESKILRIYQKFHFDSKISRKPSVIVLILRNGMSAIFQQGLKQVLRKHCNFIASSLEVVGCGSNEPVHLGLNESVVNQWFILPHTGSYCQWWSNQHKTFIQIIRPYHQNVWGSIQEHHQERLDLPTIKEENGLS